LLDCEEIMPVASLDVRPIQPAASLSTPVAQFFIPATASLQERRPRTLKHGDTFAVFDHNGDAFSGPGSPEGIFHRDTRYLSDLHLTVNGKRLILLSSTLRDDNAVLTCDLTNPDIFDANGKLILGHDLIHIRRSRFLWESSCYERLTVRNFDDRPQQVWLEIEFGADFADLFEVRGTSRSRRGQYLRRLSSRTASSFPISALTNAEDPRGCRSTRNRTNSSHPASPTTLFWRRRKCDRCSPRSGSIDRAWPCPGIGRSSSA